MKKPERQRVDVALVERGLVESRNRAQALILAGLVYSESRRIEKAGDFIHNDCPLSLKGQDHPWVSRGGVKLAAALEHFQLDPAGKIALDLGASTGGFTDVLLTQNAKKVYAVDVGYGQIAWKIRNDPRVVIHEKTNARFLDRAQIPDSIDFIVCDASFINLSVILPASLNLASDTAFLVALIKPQFEVGKARVGKGGVVRDPALHQEVCQTVKDWLSSQHPWHVLGIIPSPITGPEGNKEFLIAAHRQNSTNKKLDKLNDSKEQNN
ncbi:putative rRNA methyltransferase YqxC [Azospirillaceae bacterium]